MKRFLKTLSIVLAFVCSFAVFTACDINAKDEGTKWFNGTTYPESAKSGDYFLNKESGNIYCYDGENWEFVFAIKEPKTFVNGGMYVATINGNYTCFLVTEQGFSGKGATTEENNEQMLNSFVTSLSGGAPLMNWTKKELVENKWVYEFAMINAGSNASIIATIIDENSINIVSKTNNVEDFNATFVYSGLKIDLSILEN